MELEGVSKPFTATVVVLHIMMANYDEIFDKDVVLIFLIS